MLLGLRYPAAVVQPLFEEVMGMEQSTTYQAIVRRGRAEEARRLLLLQGESRFGPPDAATREAIESMGDLAQLEELGLRLISAGSWQELLQTPATRRRQSRRKASG